MKRYFLSLLLLAAASPVAASTYIQTNVRIETADDTIYDGDVYISDDGCTVTDADGVEHEITGAMAVCALHEAATVGGFEYVLEDSSYGLYLTTIADEAAAGLDYWSFFVNYNSASVGLADYELADGDDMILSLGGYPNAALQLNVPMKEVLDGDRIVVRVKSDGLPLAGATVYFNDTAKTTDAYGKAHFTPTAITSLDIYAEATGYTRSTTTTVRVVGAYDHNVMISGSEQNAMIIAGADYLAGEVEDGMLNDSQSVTDWAVIALAAAGLDTSLLSEAVISYDPTVDDDYATGELSRHILALAALGEDPTDQSGVNYVARLLNTKDDGQFGDQAFVNDDIFAGLALVAAGYGADNADVRKAIRAAKTSINADGGVSYTVSAATSDVDTTAYFVQLLAATGNRGSEFRAAMHYLTKQQNLDGGWGYEDHGVSNASSTSVALQTFHAAGRTPNKVRRNHSSGYNFLTTVQKPNGRFVYDADASYSYETLNTAYAMMALAHQPLPVVY